MTMMLLSSLFWLAFLIANGYGQFPVTCDNDVIVNFQFHFIETTSIPRYRLDRNRVGPNDRNCIGTVEILGKNNDIENKEYALIALGSGVFRDLPQVEILNLPENRFDYSTADMYEGSDRIHTINVFRNWFGVLDETLQFAKGVKKLDVRQQSKFSTVKLSFFDYHQALEEIDISNPDTSLEVEFESGLFQGVKNLKIIHMTGMPATVLKKDFLSGHSPSLRKVDMTRWSKLTSIENNALGEGIALEELNLSQWPLDQIPNNMFSGASIERLNLSRSKIKVLQSGAFSGLKDTQNLDLSSGIITSIEAGAFSNFAPKDNLLLSLDSEISCCNLEGLKELIGATTGIQINRNLQNYTCKTPDGDDKVVDILLNEDPSDNLACCDYELQYYNDTLKTCEACKPQSLCSEPSMVCEGEETDLITCNKCNEGFAVNPYECQACKQASDCIDASTECSLSSGNTTTLKCNTCNDGLTPDDLGICQACSTLADAKCLTFDSICIPETQNMACKLCSDDTELIDGACVTVIDNSLDIGIIVGIAVGIILVIGVISLIVLRVSLVRVRKRKEKELHEIMGIDNGASGIELHTVEFEGTDEYASKGEYANNTPSPVPSPMVESEYVNNDPSAPMVESEYANNVPSAVPAPMVESEYSNKDPSAVPAPMVESEYSNNDTSAVPTPMVESEYANNDTSAVLPPMVESEYSNNV